MQWLQYMLPVAVLLHLVEEYVLGDFLGWFRRAIPALAGAMTVRWAVATNVLFVLVVGVAALPATSVLFVLVVGAVCVVNGVLHFVMTLVLRSWSPGVVTGTLLYVPLGVGLFLTSLRDGRVAFDAALLAGISGVALHAAPIIVLWGLKRVRRER